MAKSAHFPCSAEPLQIYQDETLDDGAPMTSHAPMPAVCKPVRRPLSSSNANFVLNPPSSSNTSHSPFKQKPSPPRSPLKSPRRSKLNMVAMAPPLQAKPSTDSLLKKPFLSKFKTGPQKALHDTKDLMSGKENMHPHILPAPATIDFSIENYYPKPNGKRAMLDHYAAKEERPAKKAKMDGVPVESGDGSGLPPWDSFPPILDDGTKPPHSYAQLIGMSILRSPMRRLTLAQIYKWISDNYSYYGPTDAGWQNSIRHNLSLHRNFIKIERPKDDPGKGNYWTVEPGTEYQFLREKPTRKAAPTNENIPVMSTRLQASRPLSLGLQVVQFVEPTLPPPIRRPVVEERFQAPAEASSDATIWASDHAVPGDSGEHLTEDDPPLESWLYSPLPPPLHSSPPVSKHTDMGNATSPPITQALPPSVSFQDLASSSRKRKAGMDDSGYISSIESSAMRPNESLFLLTSEADRPRIKRARGGGRAEEAIARMRHSSPHSPSTGRSQSASGLAFSSPMRCIQEDAEVDLLPTTPNVRMMAPPRMKKAVPAESPNTSLRNHRDSIRDILQSPLRQITEVSRSPVPWSPAFRLDETYAFDTGESASDFGIFEDLTNLGDLAYAGVGSLYAGSPVKKSVKRARLGRTVSASALVDVTGSMKNKSVTSAPSLRNQSPLAFMKTSSEAFDGFGSPIKAIQQSPLNQVSLNNSAYLQQLPTNTEWPVALLDANNMAASNSLEVEDYTGVDILQGFHKIGCGPQNVMPQPSAANNSGTYNRRPLARSYSTKF